MSGGATQAREDPAGDLQEGVWGLAAGRDRRTVWDGPVVDADVHVQQPDMESLYPFLDEHWIEFSQIRFGQGLGGLGMLGSVRTYPQNAPTSVRPEWRPEDGRPAGSDLSVLQQQLLDPWEIDLAVISPSSGIDFIRHPDFAQALVAAVNDWVLAEWLEKDSRLRASLLVPARYPDAMVKEIERLGSHPGFVSVTMPVRSDRPYGNRIWHPVYRALVDHGLVMNLHWGGTPDGPPTPVGWPSWYAEEYSVEPQLYMAQVTSMIAEGVFSEFPDLRVVVAEGGFTWLPSFWWRLQKDWKGLRSDTPWVDGPVTEIIREHLRFTIAPTDAGPPEELARILGWLGSKEILLFATDYPHRHDDDLRMVLEQMPADMQEQVMYQSATDWFHL
jgi:hypothetical protein